MVAFSAHEQSVDHYYNVHTESFYLQGWDPEHIHFGIFDQAKDSAYKQDPMVAMADRASAVLRMTDLIVGSARISPTDVVVDAGCGVGGTARYVAEKHGVSVVGLNINEKQIDIAREKTKESGLEAKVTFLRCDCSQELPFPDESVDVILNIESACHYSNRARFMAECARILRPGGRIAAQDWVAADGLPQEDVERFILPVSEAWVLSNIESLASYRVLAEGVGLRVTHSQPIEDGILPNGYIMGMGYEALGHLAQTTQLTDRELANQVRFKTFADSLLGRLSQDWPLRRGKALSAGQKPLHHAFGIRIAGCPLPTGSIIYG